MRRRDPLKIANRVTTLTYVWGSLPPSLVNIFLLAASLTAAYFVPMLIGFYTARLSPNLIFVSMVVGGLVAVGYTALSWTTGLTVWAGAIVPTFIASTAVLAIGYGITRAFPRHPGSGTGAAGHQPARPGVL